MIQKLSIRIICDDRVLLVLFVIIMLHSRLNCFLNRKFDVHARIIYPIVLCNSKSLISCKNKQDIFPRFKSKFIY